MSRNFIVYQSRNHMTGTMCQTLDTKHPKSTIPYVAKTRYVARCVEHAKDVSFAEHYPAGRAIAHVDEWCAKCRAMIKSGKKVVASAVANGTPIVGGLNGDRQASFDKRHNERAKDESERKFDEPMMHEISVRKSDPKANLKTQRKARATRKPSAVVIKTA